MGSRYRMVTFKVSPDLLESINLLANRLGVSRSELIRAALIRVLKRPPTRGELCLSNYFISMPDAGEGMTVGVSDDPLGGDGLLSGARNPPRQPKPLIGKKW